MLFRRFFDAASSTCTYLLASGAGREAMIIDPVREQTAVYLQAIDTLGLRLVQAIDTHTHADHITALGALREATGCVTVMGEFTRADCVSRRVVDGERLAFDGLHVTALYTPGHTDESFSFVLGHRDGTPEAVFTGDLLLIGGSGRTDFQGGDAHKSWRSITERLFRLPDATRVYPAHDYNGRTVSSIGEERLVNPRLAGKTEDEYVALMESLELPNPKLMDIAIPANLACGRTG